jgi:Dyp-type peroxidase family
MTDRAPDFDDIQGNVFGGFNTDIQVFLGLTVSSPDGFGRAADWLAELAQSVTVVSEVRAHRAAMKLAPPDPKVTWLCVALGSRLLHEVRSDVLIRDNSFNSGMIRQAPSVLGDKTDAATWRVGSKQAPVDALLIVASNNETAAVMRANDLKAQAAAAGLAVSYEEIGRRLDDREHFGFRDGVSQPQVIGVDPDGKLGAGHFVFGYPKAPGLDPFSPVIDPIGFTDNGSLLVFRRLVQDVPVFRDFCTMRAKTIAASWPGFSEQHLGALLVGRWRSGAPVEQGQTSDPGSANPPDNRFDFHDDLDAHSCPLGAHIRKVNPREGKKDVLEVPRMLRRGIPFGRSFDEAPQESDRGLLFLAFQTSVKAQFEFLTRNWMNSRDNPAPGSDVLVGRSETTRSLTIMGPAGPVDVATEELNWIVPTGGAYLFVPSRSGLGKLAMPVTPLGLWKAKQLFAQATDSIRSALFA